MKDERALAYVNLFAVLGAIPKLCEIDEKAHALIEGERVSIGFAVKGGPSATLAFSDGACTLCEGVKGCKIKLPFSSPAKFNGMIDGTVTPIPSKGLLRVGFLLKKFMPLTDILSSYLRPAEGALDDPEFFRRSTTLMLHVIAGAVAALGNEDKVGQASASYIVDGKIRLSIAGGPAAAIVAKDHRLQTAEAGDENDCLSYMQFESMQVARDLFDGRANAVYCVGMGLIRIGGMISQIDNVNRILDRVALYLA